MKRTIVYICLLALCLTGMIGCSPDQTGENTTTTSVSTSTTLTTTGSPTSTTQTTTATTASSTTSVVTTTTSTKTATTTTTSAVVTTTTSAISTLSTTSHTDQTVTSSTVHTTTPTISSEPYVTIDKKNIEQETSQIDWDTVIKKIPSDYYEQYPGQLSAPLTATLYKNGETIPLDIYDPRLVRLLNFYNNSVYYRNHSYTQGSYNSEYPYANTYEYRLMLTYAPIHSSMEDSFDKQIVYGSAFIGVRSNIPFGDDPFSTFGRWPLKSLISGIEWLPLFGL